MFFTGILPSPATAQMTEMSLVGKAVMEYVNVTPPNEEAFSQAHDAILRVIIDRIHAVADINPSLNQVRSYIDGNDHDLNKRAKLWTWAIKLLEENYSPRVILDAISEHTSRKYGEPFSQATGHPFAYGVSHTHMLEIVRLMVKNDSQFGPTFAEALQQQLRKNTTPEAIETFLRIPSSVPNETRRRNATENDITLEEYNDFMDVFGMPKINEKQHDDFVRATDA
ncbi:MAG: hypothetical protein ABW189_07155 [Rickettsiales bacterium]